MDTLPEPLDTAAQFAYVFPSEPMSLAILDNSELCMHQCRAQCCVGPSYLWLTPEEMHGFARHAEQLNVPSVVHQRADGGVVRFLEQVGERCPMLDPHTAACRIYDRRPARCRTFPEAPRDGCALSQRLMGTSWER